MERETFGLNLGLISLYAFVCLCRCLAKFAGQSAVIIPAQSLIKGQFSCVTLMMMRTLQSKAVQTD